MKRALYENSASVANCSVGNDSGGREKQQYREIRLFPCDTNLLIVYVLSEDEPNFCYFKKTNLHW